MKHVMIGTIVGIVCAIIAMGAGVFILTVFMMSSVPGQISGTGGILSTATSTKPTTSITITSTQPSRIITPTTPMPTSALPSPTSSASVSFQIEVTNVASPDLLSRIVTTQVTNTGTADAHNVRLKLEAYVQGSKIKIYHGQDYAEMSVAALLPSKANVTKDSPTLSVGFFDGLRMSQNGATLLLTIISDEKTETLSYEFKP